MSLEIKTGQEVTFTITAEPRRGSLRKTLQRLMRMQRDIQKGLDQLADRRRRHDNVPHRRGGRLWMVRAKMTSLTRVARGQQFRIFVTPQIVPDLKSVAAYIKVG